MAPPSRRARRASAMTLAASASLRALPLRRVLLVIVFVFVLLPLFVYNVVVTLDYNPSGGASSSPFFRDAESTGHAHVPSPLPPCLNVSAITFLSHDGLSQLQRECTNGSFIPVVVPVSVATKEPGDNKGPIVHFIHVPLDAVPLLEGEKASAVEKELVTFLQFAAVQSVRKLVQPRMMLLHYVDREPRGVWYTQCQRHLSLHKVLAPKIAAKATTAGVKAKPKSLKYDTSAALNIYQRRQLMEFLTMLRVLQKHGGVAFSDFNTFVLRDTLLQSTENVGERAAIVSQAAANAGGDGNVFRVGVHTLQAPADHEFIKYLEHELLALIAADDPKLHRMPLEQLVGQLTLARYNHEHAAGKTNSNSTVSDVVVGSSPLFEGVPQHEIPRLLSATVGESSEKVSFRGVTAFHLDKYDFQLKRNDTEPLEAIQKLERTIVAAADILEKDEKGEDKASVSNSLFHALLRFAVGLNSTAELDRHFN